MKKIYFVTVMIISIGLLFGCAGIQFSQQTEDVMLKSTARLAGYDFAKRNGELAEQALPIAKAILAAAQGESPDTGELLKSGVSMLLSKVSDPVIAASISDVVSLIKFKGPDVTLSVQNVAIKTALEGFIEGIMSRRK